MILHVNIFNTAFVDFMKIGWDHIIDLQAYDHLLFIMVLCAAFTLKDWKKILAIITAFTIGHSLTLALSALNYIFIPSTAIEILIPLTIFATAIANLIRKEHVELKTFDARFLVNYAVAMAFGLIHGLGFANNFRFFLGEESSIVAQLFAFNTGLELGQIVVVIAFMGLLWLIVNVIKMKHREWMVFVSGAGAGVALIMILDTIK
jgi:hypothetical protein